MARCDAGTCSESFKLAFTGSIPVRVTEQRMARCDVGVYSQSLKLDDAGSIPARVTMNDDADELALDRLS